MAKTLEYASSPAPVASPRHGWAAAVAGVIVLAIVISQTGPFFIDVLLGLATDGAIAVLYLLAAFGFGAWLTPAGPRSLRVASAGALGLGAMGLITLGLGLAGALNAIAAWALIVVGLALLAVRFRSAKQSMKAIRPSVDLWWCVPFAVVLGVALLSVAIVPGFLWKDLDPHPYDVLSYHLQVPREWYDLGQIVPLTHNAFSFFPMGMEMHYLAAMHLRGGPWAGMYLCTMMTLLHGVLTLGAVVGVARSLGAPRARSFAAALAVAGVPWVFQLSTIAYVETGVMLYSTLAIGYTALALKRDDARRLTAVAGVFAGLACGMKYTAFAMTAAPVCILFVVISFVPSRSGENAKRWVAAAGVVILTTALVASPWLIRNVAWTGNPVFPLVTDVFGKAHFTDDQVDRYRIAHRPPDAEASVGKRITIGWDRTELSPQFAYLVLPVGAVAAIALCRRREALFIGLSVVAMTLVWLSATHVMPRFLTPIVPLLGVLIALAPVPTVATVSYAAAQCAIGLWLVFGWLSPRLELGRQGLFYLSDLTIIATDETRAAAASSDKVALIGDAQGFFYAIPSQRLIYRSVFDVSIPPGGNVVDGWLGKSVEQLRREGCWVIINTSELNRLCGSYRHLPKPPPPPFDQVRPEPIVLPPIR